MHGMAGMANMNPFDTHLDAATDELTSGVDYYIGRICRNNPHLRLEQEGTGWLVVDIANPGRYDPEEIMLRTDTWSTAYRFLVAFLIKQPEATMDTVSIEATRAMADNAGHSVKVHEKPELRLVV